MIYLDCLQVSKGVKYFADNIKTITRVGAGKHTLVHDYLKTIDTAI
jgi:hypothetical protein